MLWSGIAQPVWRLATGWTVWGSNPADLSGCITINNVAERSKARVCGRSLAGIAGSNPATGMDVCVVCVVSKG